MDPHPFMTTQSLVSSFYAAIFSLGALHGADAEGFVPMFNGKDLSGWQTTGNWVVEADGTIALIPRKGESGWTRYGPT